MHRLSTKAGCNRCGIGIVARMDIRFDELFHALRRIGLWHSVAPPHRVERPANSSPCDRYPASLGEKLIRLLRWHARGSIAGP